MRQQKSVTIITFMALACLLLMSVGCEENIKDKQAMSRIKKIALISFIGKSTQYGNTRAHEPLLRKTFDEFKKVFDGQKEIELIPSERVTGDAVYKQLQNLTLPDDVLSPVSGLTYLKAGVPDQAAEPLCRSLGVDGLLVVIIEYDFKLVQSGSDVEFNIKRYAALAVPPDGHSAWGDMKTPETLSRVLMVMLHNKTLALKLGAKWVVFAGPDEEDWKELIRIANETTPLPGEAGAQLAKSFLDAAKTARTSP